MVAHSGNIILLSIIRVDKPMNVMKSWEKVGGLVINTAIVDILWNSFFLFRISLNITFFID